MAPARPDYVRTSAPTDPVIQRIWAEGMGAESQAADLMQTLLDSIGPRLTGSPGHKSGNEWLVDKYQEWGVPARNEQYGTWASWRRGISHVDLISPRVRSLEGMMLAWSPGTPNGQPVEAEVVVLPEAATGIAATAVFCFITAWNEYAFALIMTNRRAQTAPPFIPSQVGTGLQDWTVIAAGTVLFLLPVAIFTFLLRNHLLRGMSFGAIRK